MDLNVVLSVIVCKQWIKPTITITAIIYFGFYFINGVIVDIVLNLSTR